MMRNRTKCALAAVLAAGLGTLVWAGDGPSDNLRAFYRNPVMGADQTNGVGAVAVQLGLGNGFYGFSGGVAVAAPVSAICQDRVASPIAGRTANKFLGEVLTPPEGWNGKEPSIDADAGGKAVWIEFAKEVVAIAAGPIRVNWPLTDGTTNVESSVVSSSPTKRPVRLYWTHQRPSSLSDTTYRTLQNAGPTVTFESNYKVHLYGTPDVGIYGENGQVGDVRLNGNDLEAFEDTRGTFLIAYSRLDEATSRRELLAYELVEVLEPKQTLIDVKIGNQLKPQTRSYDTDELFPRVTRGLTDASESGEIYVYQHSTGDQQNYLWAIRDSSENPWKIEVFWRAKEELDVVWPFEVDIYAASWDVEGAQPYVRDTESAAGGAAQAEPVVYYPSGVSIDAMAYQVVSDGAGGTKVREHIKMGSGVFYSTWADEATFALLKYTSGENVWFQTVRSIPAKNAELLASLALDFAGACSNVAYRTGSATNVVGAIPALTNVAFAAEIRAPFAGEDGFFYPGWIKPDHAVSADAWPIEKPYNPNFYSYPTAYVDLEELNSAIFPVNLGELEIWWSLPSYLLDEPRENSGSTTVLNAAIYFPAIPVTYTIHTPEQIAAITGDARGCPQIVIASGAGSAGWSLNDHLGDGDYETSSCMTWEPGSSVTGVVTKLVGKDNTAGVTSNFTFEARLLRWPGVDCEMNLAAFYAPDEEGNVREESYLRLGFDAAGNFYLNGTNMTEFDWGLLPDEYAPFIALPDWAGMRDELLQGMHVALVHTAEGVWKYYLNGNLAGTFAGHPCAIDVAQDTANLLEPAPKSYRGQIHYLRLWSTARTAKDIDQNRYLACAAASQLVFQYDGTAQDVEENGTADATSGAVAYGYLADSSGHDARGYLGFGRQVDGCDASLWMTVGEQTNVCLRLPKLGQTFPSDATIYAQNDRTQPGYNPNEEHALMLGGVAYAMRCDLNKLDKDGEENETFTSLPYVLVQSTDADTLKPKMCALRVVPENDMYRFRTYLDAGSMIQSPSPLSRLQPANLQTFVSGPLFGGTKACFLDRNSRYWAHQAGDDGGSTNYVFELSYPSQSSFDYVGTDSVAAGTTVAWMSSYSQRDDWYVWTCSEDAELHPEGSNLFPARPDSDAVGSAIDYSYIVVWPDNVACLYVNDTLHEAKNGLPAVRGQLSAKIVYQQSAAGTGGNDAVVLIDPETRRAGSLPTIPDEVRNYRDPKTAKRKFTDLPPFLRDRFQWNPTAFYDSASGETRELELTGQYVADGNYQFSYLNVMDARSKAVLLDPDLVAGADDANWKKGIESIATEPLVLTNDVTPFTALALATTGKGAGYVTLVFNDSTNIDMVPKSENVTMSVIKVVPELYNGYLHVIQSENPLDRQIDMKYSSDFGGKPENWEFEWQYAEPENGSAPTDEQKWLSLAGSCGKEGVPMLDWITVGDAGTFGLSDHYVRCRYRAGGDGTSPLPVGGTNWTAWCAPKLAEGWIKRVLKAINPFDQRIQDFLNNEVDTSLSMIQQAGAPYQGDVPLNLDALTESGLIEIYETVLNQAKKLSIDDDSQGTATESLALALQMAAGRIAELYMVLGNEAYADALNPTIDLGSDSGVDDTAESSIFPFMNQCEDLLDEELALLRGRDLSDEYADSWETDVEPSEYPYYNRLAWNFTADIMGGQVAYVENYGIRDVCGASDAEDPTAKDGVIDVYDAKNLYPQGHGDAWGHYLSAEKGYYALLRHKNFGWKPQIEGVLAGQTEITIGLLHEKRFAEIAEMKAKVGEKIVADTYRQNYEAGDDDSWLAAEDDVAWEDADGNEVRRGWGVDEWATRAHLGAYYDWAVVNALLPARNAQEGLVKMLDRESTKELAAIAASARRIQATARSADSGLNPLGLSDHAIPFDISPDEIDAGKTHFEQILERAKKATKVAKEVFDRAKACSNKLRDQNASADYENMVDDEEAAIERRLIEIYGYPYDDDIGPGKTYEEGYSGPDIYHYYYIETYDLDGSGGIDGEYRGVTSGEGSYGRYVDVTVDNYSMITTNITGTFQAPIDASLADNGLIGNLIVGTLSWYQDKVETVGSYIDPWSKYTGIGSDDFALPMTVVDTAGDALDGTIDYTFSVAAWSNAPVVVSYYIGENGFTSKPSDWHGQRKAEGETQIALNAYAIELSTISAKESVLAAANEKLVGLIDELTALDYITQMNYVIDAAKTEAENYIAACKQNAEAVAQTLELVSQLKTKLCEAGVEAFPTTVGLANDVTSVARSALLALQSGLDQLIQEQINDVLFGSQNCDAALEELEEWYASQKLAWTSNSEREKKIAGINEQVRTVRAALAELETAFLAANDARMNYAKIVAEGDELQAERERLRIQWAADLSQTRYRNMMYQILRNDELTRYNQAFELAAKYVFLAARAYDYETGLLESDSKNTAGSAFMSSIVKARALGRFTAEGEPLVGGSEGDPGLADILARMETNWGVLKTRLGFNNTQGDLDSVSLRKDLFRKDDTEEGDAAWRTALADCWVDDLRTHPAFSQHCQPFDPMNETEPGFAIPFQTTIAARKDLFGNDLAGASIAYSSTYFATKLRAVGVWIEGENAGAMLPKRPEVYLIPSGLDYLRAPIRASSNAAKTRSWQVVDQVLPVPYSLAESDWESTSWSMLKDIFSNELCTQRRHPAIRANVGATFDESATMTYNARLIGRSVWNDQWYLFIPAASLNADDDEAKKRFLSSVRDIHLNLKTYSMSGN